MNRNNPSAHRSLDIAFCAGTLLAFWLMSPTPTLAQSGSVPEGIVARGTATVTVEPSALRLTMSVKAQGKDPKSAVRSLAAHKQRVRKELGEMNANSESVQFTSTQLSTGGSNNSEQQQYMRMMQRQMGQVVPDLGEVPTVYTATASLRVDWPLPTTDPEALSLLPQGLRDQISKRDFQGDNNAPDLDEESLEKLEASQAMGDETYMYMEEGDSGEARIQFVGKLSPDQRRDGLKSAIAKAKTSAQVTAEALEVKLGKLKTLWPNESTSSTTYSRSAYMGSEYYASYGDTDADATEDSQSDVTAATLDGLRFSVSIFAVYDFE
ncbi:hypothetical protein Enr13x_34250 [Stieleria neptunia]|uniref:Oxidative stress defense protein n=1 Tax=Stieleria neptunia TaxID=2527979 RepID=A0A518HS05_9BACT|nr:SIMPL domain-containing protein [Stieleria neptunia]QDV43568.1 hypothetical protein Enr13x_34250 [Stieleria neptunia]